MRWWIDLLPLGKVEKRRGGGVTKKGRGGQVLFSEAPFLLSIAQISYLLFSIISQSLVHRSKKKKERERGGRREEKKTNKQATHSSPSSSPPPWLWRDVCVCVCLFFFFGRVDR